MHSAVHTSRPGCTYSKHIKVRRRKESQTCYSSQQEAETGDLRGLQKVHGRHWQLSKTLFQDQNYKRAWDETQWKDTYLAFGRPRVLSPIPHTYYPCPHIHTKPKERDANRILIFKASPLFSSSLASSVSHLSSIMLLSLHMWLKIQALAQEMCAAEEKWLKGQSLQQHLCVGIKMAQQL